MYEPWVAVIIGSENDKKKLEESYLRRVFDCCEVKHEESVFSAHRHQSQLEAYCKKAANEGAVLFIAAAGMSAHLPGSIATITNYAIPVLGVALSSTNYPDARDAVESISRMPAGCPVSFMGIDKAGFTNAAIAACQIIGTRCDMNGESVLKKLAEYREQSTASPEEAYYSTKEKEEDKSEARSD